MAIQEYEKKHLDYVLKHAGESCVLLKSNGDFPLEKAGKLAAFGAGLRYTVKGGTGSGEVNSRETFTIEQGLQNAGFEITSAKWLDAYDKVRADAKKDFVKQMKAESRARHENMFLYIMGKNMREPDHNLVPEGEGDTAIYVVSRISGEGSDREAVPGDVLLAQSEIRDILALNKRYRRFMLVLNVGGVVDLSPVVEVNNILLLSQLGVDCGKVLADILLGKQNPSGKLTTTCAAWEAYSREGTFGDWNDNRYNEGIYVGYRYFDTFGKKALFPFGYGLSYTSFSLQTTAVEAVADTVTVKVSVHNTGAVSGKEVVQVYCSKPSGRLDQPYQELVGFAKTALLAPGEAQELAVTFTLSDFASYDEKTAAYILEEGEYILRVGNSSAQTLVAAVLKLDQAVVTLQAKNCLGTPDFTDLKAPAHQSEEVPAEALRIAIKAKEITQRAVSYDAPVVVDERVKALTDEELCYLGIGSFAPSKGALSIIGNAASHVAGAAGETTSRLTDKGIGYLVMSDGPAGLRLARAYYEDENGAHDAGGAGMIPESILEYMNPVVKFIAKALTGGSQKPPKHAQILEHAATMIPIGTAIAQSFNYALAKAYGDIVGDEMERMGVQLWLAPALNIHRSILCGRNFEYYSEDPLVSGLMAAAITEGVQAHKGCGTTIKHYAANNAETNRYCNNSQVSERAMREIYLRGFGICVRKSQPKAVMTSYNLLNGTHTSEHRGLIEDVLRSEFGFAGVVMTDWVIDVMTSKRSIYRNALAGEVAKAGGDLFMPGGQKDYQNLLSERQSGRLSRQQLEINATRVLHAIDDLT